jgi:26S proteasome non-ATPase regulatory subunit 10
MTFCTTNTMSPSDLFKAALDGQSEHLRSLLQANESLAHAQDSNSDNRTALHHAASSGSLESVQALTALNANLEATDGMGFTPLIVAVSSGKVEVVKELIGSGADVKAKNARDQTALHYAASKGWVEVGLSLDTCTRADLELDRPLAHLERSRHQCS